MNLNKLDGELDILIHYTDEPTITLRGEVDYRNMERVKQAICSIAEGGQTSINVDLEGLIFMDSTGLSALVDAARTVIPNGGEIRLKAPSTQLVKVLANSGFAEFFKCLEISGRRAPVSTPVKPDTREIIEFEVPSRAEMISHIRARVADFASQMPLDADEIDDIKLAVGEASSNALRHGANPDWPKVGVRMERRKDCLKVFISDKGAGFDPDSVCLPSIGDLCEGGRGIMFMRSLMDDVKFNPTSPGTCVELTKYFKPVHS